MAAESGSLSRVLASACCYLSQLQLEHKFQISLSLKEALPLSLTDLCYYTCYIDGSLLLSV